MESLYNRLKAAFFSSAPSIPCTPDDLFKETTRKRSIDDVTQSEAAESAKLAKQRRTVQFQSMAKTTPRNLTLNTPAKFGFVVPKASGGSSTDEGKENDNSQTPSVLKRPITTPRTPRGVLSTFSGSRENVTGKETVKGVARHAPVSAVLPNAGRTNTMPLGFGSALTRSIRPQNEWDRLWHPAVPSSSRQASIRGALPPSTPSINRTPRSSRKAWIVTPYVDTFPSGRVLKREAETPRQTKHAKRDMEWEVLEAELDRLHQTGKSEYIIDREMLKPRAETHSGATKSFRPKVYNTRELTTRLKEQHEKYQRKLKYQEERMIHLLRKVKTEEEELRKKPKLPVIPAESLEIIDDIFNDRYDDEHTHAKGLLLEVKQRDLILLSGTEWLNDTVINMYMALINDRAKQPGATVPAVHCFNTHFLSKLQDKGFPGVKRWTRKFNLFEKDYVVIPVHLGNHWCAAVINVKDKVFEYYDSLGGRNPSVLKMLRDYLQEEHMSKTGQSLDLSEWTDYAPGAMCPQQNNCSDCGVFLCQFGEYRSRGADLTFSQADMRYFRKRIVHEILQMKLMA